MLPDCFFRSYTSITSFLASAVGAKAILSEVFGLEHEDGTYNDAFDFWFDSAKCEVAPEIKKQRYWFEPIFDNKNFSEMILRKKNY